MQPHKIVALIVFLIFSVINLALAAPVLVRATASWKRWNPSHKWWTNAADWANAPPGLGSRDSPDPHDPHPLPLGSPPPAHLPDLDAHPQSSQETDSPDSASSRTHSSAHTTDSESLDLTSYSSDVTSHSQSPGPLPSPPRHGNLDIDLNKPPPSPGPTGGQPLPPAPASDPGSSKRPYPDPSLDPGPSKRPYRPSDPGPFSWADPPSDPEPSIPHPPPSPGPQQHESEIIFGDLLKSGRLKRHVSGSGSLNAAEGVAGYP